MKWNSPRSVCVIAVSGRDADGPDAVTPPAKFTPSVAKSTRYPAENTTGQLNIGCWLYTFVILVTVSVASPPTVSAPNPENVIVPTVTGSSTVTSSAAVFTNTHVSSAVNAVGSPPQFAGLENLPSPAPPVHMYVAAEHTPAASATAIPIAVLDCICQLLFRIVQPLP